MRDTIFACSLSLMLAAHGIASDASSSGGAGNAVAPPATAKPSIAVIPPAGSEAISFAPMVRKVAPSVVTVFSSRTVRPEAALPPGSEQDPILRHFFGGDPGREQKQRGLGSGVVVRADGYILTNNHVVEEADEVKVAFADTHTQYLAKVIGTDPKTDLAVLKIEGGSRALVAIEFGDSSKVEVGNLVFAIGNPFGVGQTVTMGIISAVGRGVGLADYEDFLQTDASINPGNSGGPLVDSTGKLVGINTAIISPTGSNLGIGFAVPVSLARGIMDSIIDKGKVVRGYLGVVIEEITPAIAKKFELPSEQGALISDVQEGGPAAKAGLREGDVIIAANDAKVEDSRHLRLMIAQMLPGTKVSLTTIRDGKERKVDATLQDLAESAADDAGPRRGGKRHAPKSDQGASPLGIRLEDADANLRRTFHIPADVKGAVITEVKPGSKADEAGMKPGQVIIGVEHKPVESADEAAAAIDQAKDDILLRIWSDGGRLYLVIRRD